MVLGLLPLVAPEARRCARGAPRVSRCTASPPRFDYNLIVIGAGSAGSVTAYIAAAVKAKVALIEKDALGRRLPEHGLRAEQGADANGDACSPTRATARRFGIARVDGRVRLRRGDGARAAGDAPDRAARLGRALHRARRRGHAGRRALVIAVGRSRCDRGRRIAPPREHRHRRPARGRSCRRFPGSTRLPYVTSDTLWELRELPRRFVVLGGGPIGCELGAGLRAPRQRGDAWSRWRARLLPREDADVAAGSRSALRAPKASRSLTGHEALRVRARGRRRAVSSADARRARGRASRSTRCSCALGREARTSWASASRSSASALRAERTIDADPWLAHEFPEHLRLRRRRRAVPVHACRVAPGVVRRRECAASRRSGQYPRRLLA